MTREPLELVPIPGQQWWPGEHETPHQSVPEPSTLVVMAVAFLAVWWARRRA